MADQQQAVPEQGSDKLQGDKLDHVVGGSNALDTNAGAPSPAAPTPSNAGAEKASA